MLSRWWTSLSGESKTAIIAAVVAAAVGPVISKLVGVRMIRWYYVNTLKKLDVAEDQIRQESKDRKIPSGIIDVNDVVFYPSLEQKAIKAGVSLARAKRAIRWHEGFKKYGD